MCLQISFISSVEHLINTDGVEKIYAKFNVNRENANDNITELIAVTSTKLDIKSLIGLVPIRSVCSADLKSEFINSSFLLWSQYEDEGNNLIDKLVKCINIINEDLGNDVEELIVFDTYESECGYSNDLVLFVKFSDESKLFFEDCDEISAKINLEFPNLYLTMLYQDRGGVRLWKKLSLF